MSRYTPVPLSAYRTTTASSKPSWSGANPTLQLGPVQSEALLSPKVEVVSRIWGEELAEYVNLLAIRTLRHRGVDPETLYALLGSYSDEIRCVYHIETGERTYSDAI